MIINVVGLTICVPELIWTVINFFLLLFLLKIILYKPILNILDERKAKVTEGLSEGKQAEKALEETNAALKKELSEQNGKARELIGQAKTEAEKEREELIENAHKEAESLHRGVLERIKAEEEAARKDIEADMPELISLLAKKLLGSEDAECSPELIKSCVEEVKDIKP